MRCQKWASKKVDRSVTRHAGSLQLQPCWIAGATAGRDPMVAWWRQGAAPPAVAPARSFLLVQAIKNAPCGAFFSASSKNCKHSAVAVSDPALGQIVGRHFNLDLVTGQDADVVLAHPAGDMGDDLVAVLQLDPEHGVREGFGDSAFEFDDVVFRHVGAGAIPEVWYKGEPRQVRLESPTS